MIWLWLIPYLVAGLLAARLFSSRFETDTTDAFVIILLWPLGLLYLGVRQLVEVIGRLGGGR